MKHVTIDEYDYTKHYADILYIANNLRQIDRLEVEAFGFTDYLQAIEKSMDNAEVVFVVKGDKPLCVFGLGEESNGIRVVWLLASEGIEKYKREFIEYSYPILKFWFKEYGPMFNYISVENINSIRWLKWLGANFSEPFLIGGQGFKEFTLDERSFSLCV